MCSGLGSSAHLRGREEGPDLSPSDLLKEGPRSILAFPAAGAVASRWMGKESVVAQTWGAGSCEARCEQGNPESTTLSFPFNP